MANLKKLQLAILVCFLLLSGCQKPATLTPSIIPIPLQLEYSQGQFMLSRETPVVYDHSNKTLAALASTLQKGIRAKLTAEPNSPAIGAGTIRLVLSQDAQANPEGYGLTISSERILIESTAPNGLFYGIQTLLQLIPQIAGPQSAPLPALKIKDQPRFPWRGLHLDCCRHFMPPDFIKKYLDSMAMYKLNVFHWHLTEDQGWRIEIKAFPRLTEIGAWRKETRIGHASEQPAKSDGQPHGGFYTQEQIRDIVAYASERFITVVPELEMPGHAQAAIAAYPELGCTGKPVEVWTDWGVSPHIFNVEENTFRFLEQVVDELCDLFPGPYIHVGGDEAIKDQWQNTPRIQERMKELGVDNEEALQSYFITRMEQYINSKGKTVIGWDEILEGGLAPNAIVMSWRGTKGGIEAARAGHQVIMSPGSHCYFDHYQADPRHEPLAIGGYTPLAKVYRFDPLPQELSKDEAQFVLGGQANLWTEYIPTPEHAEYMLFPRITALAEVLWSAPKRKNWPEFKRRAAVHQEWYRSQGIRFCPNTLDAPLEMPQEGESAEAPIPAP